MAVVTAATVELTDELASAFLEELASSGSVRSAARAVGVDRQLIYRRRWGDQEFRNEWDAARTRRLYDASNELFAAIDELSALIGEERAFDELINTTFGTQDPPPRRVDPAQLAVAREHLHSAGKAWAAAVVYVESLAQVPDRSEAVA